MAKSRNQVNPNKSQPPQAQRQLPNQQSAVVSQQWSGPLPPPAALAHFNEIIPGGAERIMSMCEREQEHRIKYDQIGIVATVNDTRRGHYIGGIISIAAVCGAIYTAYIGAHPAVSIALVSLPILGIIKAFMGNTNR